METLEKVWPEWQIESVLGEGSFGKVYKIKREDVGGTFYAALKEIRIPKDKSEIKAVMAEGMDEASTTAYFKGIMEEIVKEFALMEKLKGNTNIVSYEDHKVIAHDDGYGWDILIRMELLTPLTQYLTEHQLTEALIVRLGTDMCHALELCERYQVIHRDIKPENIFVSELGDFKLGDFGVARTAEKTMSNMSKKGTYTYMAPEVYKGESYNATVDIYSLGIVLYRLLNDNRAPFLPPISQPITFNDRETALERRISGEPLPDPVYGCEALRAVIRKACAYRSEDRYQTAAEMRRALENTLNGTQASAVQAAPEIAREQSAQAAAAMNISQKAANAVPEQSVKVSASEEEKTESAFQSIPPVKEAQTAKKEMTSAKRATIAVAVYFAIEIILGNVVLMQASYQSNLAFGALYAFFGAFFQWSLLLVRRCLIGKTQQNGIKALTGLIDVGLWIAFGIGILTILVLMLDFVVEFFDDCLSPELIVTLLGCVVDLALAMVVRFKFLNEKVMSGEQQ